MTDFRSDTTDITVNQNLHPHQKELLSLAELAGIQANPVIIWILVQLLNLNISPEAIYGLLKLIMKSTRARNRAIANTSKRSSSTSSQQS